MYREKIDLIVRTCKDDEDVMSRLKAVIDSAASYVEKVSILEGTIITASSLYSNVDYRNRVEKDDSDRSFAHDSLINNIKILNRYLEQMYKIEKLYIGDIEVRREVGDFAGELIHELFTTRR